ncbi:hypothetical protein IQ268_21080 [Oculatella sp. LEGE 06141]|nr:hypothetical protein [Oculatella sp. LEGE 06141]
MDICSSYGNRPITSHEQQLYNHWLQCVETESPGKLLWRFRKLFIDGVAYPDHAVWRSLEQVLASSSVERDFKFILNRSCHIFINRWLMQPRLQTAIPELVALFEAHPTGTARTWTTQRLRCLVRQFKQTEQYTAMRRLAHVIAQARDESVNNTKPLGTLVHRYPYLYKHGLLTEDSTLEQWQRVRQLQHQVQRRFEVNLSHYITHRLRHSYCMAANQLSLPYGVAAMPPNGRSAQNPTLLSDRSLDAAVKHYGGKVDGCNTYRDIAQHFLTYSKQAPCYRTFKRELYDYLTASIDPKYGNRQFNQRLAVYLDNILSCSNGDRLNDTLLTGTCRHLLNFLVVQSSYKLDHFVYSDLTANLGTSVTIGLLLKIVLLCSRVKSHLEKRFAILFNHYELHDREGVNWLIESLEHLNIALSLNFSRMNLSY